MEFIESLNTFFLLLNIVLFKGTMTSNPLKFNFNCCTVNFHRESDDENNFQSFSITQLQNEKKKYAWERP